MYAGKWVTKYSALGYPFEVWEKPVPRIRDHYLYCVIFLYPDPDEAKIGKGFGGSGFLYSMPFERNILDSRGRRREHTYAVTNSHVIREAQAPFIRVNTNDGQTDVLPYDYRDWTDDNADDDLAVCYIDTTTPKPYQHTSITRAMLLSPPITSNMQTIGIGTETVTIGRFITFNEVQQNTPLVRFGNIAASEPILVPHGERRGFEQESWLIESRSISGYSGSPVFMAEIREDRLEMLGLLGINWGHLPREVRIKRKDGSEVPDGAKADMNSGMMTVIPTYRLLHFLNREDLMTKRKEIEEKAQKEVDENTGGGVPDVEVEPEQYAEFTEEDFEEALRKVARPNKPKDDKQEKDAK